MMIKGYPMPCIVEIVFEDGSRAQVEGVMLECGETFQSAAKRMAKDAGGTLLLTDHNGIEVVGDLQ